MLLLLSPAEVKTLGRRGRPAPPPLPPRPAPSPPQLAARPLLAALGAWPAR